MSREAGAQAEEKAARFLEGLGYAILDRNFRSKMGEIDIIARDGETVVFVEVRARSGRGFGSPAETVTHLKQRKIIKTAAFYSQIKRLDCPLRFDVVSIEAGALDHIPDAFQAC